MDEKDKPMDPLRAKLAALRADALHGDHRAALAEFIGLFAGAVEFAETMDASQAVEAVTIAGKALAHTGGA